MIETLVLEFEPVEPEIEEVPEPEVPEPEPFDASGCRFEVPGELVPGLAAEFRLWAGASALLTGWRLYAGARDLGPGVLVSAPATLESQLDLRRERGAELGWPVQQILRAEALTDVAAWDAAKGRPRAWAASGQTVTGKVMRQGYLGVQAREDLELFGSLRVKWTRAPWHRRWTWPAPVERYGLQWFFLVRPDKGLHEALSLALPAFEQRMSVPGPAFDAAREDYAHGQEVERIHDILGNLDLNLDYFSASDVALWSENDGGEAAFTWPDGSNAGFLSLDFTSQAIRRMHFTIRCRNRAGTSFIVGTDPSQNSFGFKLDGSVAWFYLKGYASQASIRYTCPADNAWTEFSGVISSLREECSLTRNGLPLPIYSVAGVLDIGALPAATDYNIWLSGQGGCAVASLEITYDYA